MTSKRIPNDAKDDWHGGESEVHSLILPPGDPGPVRSEPPEDRRDLPAFRQSPCSSVTLQHRASGGQANQETDPSPIQLTFPRSLWARPRAGTPRPSTRVYKCLKTPKVSPPCPHFVPLAKRLSGRESHSAYHSAIMRSDLDHAFRRVKKRCGPHARKTPRQFPRMFTILQPGHSRPRAFAPF